MADLAKALGAPPPPEFDDLSADERSHLAAALQAASAKRSQQIDTSIEESLAHLPGLLRGTVRRALGM